MVARNLKIEVYFRFSSLECISGFFYLCGWMIDSKSKVTCCTISLSQDIATILLMSNQSEFLHFLIDLFNLSF